VKAVLIIFKPKNLRRAVVLPMHIVNAGKPEVRDFSIKRRLDKIIVVVPVRARAVDGVEVAQVWVADV
jgi:hypothetical protein